MGSLVAGSGKYRVSSVEILFMCVQRAGYMLLVVPPRRAARSCVKVSVNSDGVATSSESSTWRRWVV